MRWNPFQVVVVAWLIAVVSGCGGRIRVEPTRLTDYAGDETTPEFSPDGRRLAFSADHKGTYDLYLLGLDN